MFLIFVLIKSFRQMDKNVLFVVFASPYFCIVQKEHVQTNPARKRMPTNPLFRLA